MQIQLLRETLLKPMAVAAGIVERRHTLPILSYVLVKAEKGQISFTATDLEVEVVSTIGGSVEKSGELTVPARKLFDICRALPEATTVTLSKQGEKVILKAGRSRFSLSTLSSTDFPSVEPNQFQQVLTIKQSNLWRAIERTAFCIAQQDVRYYLNGLYLEMDGIQLRAVATDGHRMAITELDCPLNKIEPIQVIVPKKAVQELSRLLDGDEDKTVQVEIGKNHIRFSLKGLIFTAKLIDGKFPDYTKVIPSIQGKQVQLDRMSFREALARVAILASEKYRGIRLNLESGRLQISAHNPEQEEAVEELETNYNGDTLEIGFNVNYLIEATGAIASNEIILGLNDPTSSCTLRASNDSSTQYIIMPMRL